MLRTPDAAVEFQPSIIRKAQLNVCSAATDLDDARILLDMLGLVEDSVRFPSMSAVVGTVGRSPARPTAAPLPASAYGAGAVAPPDAKGR